MAINKKTAPNIDESDPSNYPDGRIRDNTGAGNGTPVNRLVYSDIHEFFAKLMRLAEIAYSGLPDNETAGYQLVDAIVALAGKNDYVIPINSDGGVLSIPLKLSILKLNESLTCLAAVDYAGEQQIKGSGVVIKTIAVPVPFRAGEYVRLVSTNIGITLIRLVDANNLDTLSGDLNYLKAATEAEEYLGSTLSKSTTPYTNQLAFARRVIGLDSGLFLASLTRNGLLSKEDKAILNSIPANPVRNVGWFSGLDIGGSQIGTAFPISGNITSAVVQTRGPDGPPDNVSETSILVTFQVQMTGLNYFVRTHIESQGSIGSDNDAAQPIFKPITNNSFLWIISERKGTVQSLKIHLEVVQIS